MDHELIFSENMYQAELAKYYVDTVSVRARNLVMKILKRGMERDEFKKCDPEMTARILLSSLVFAAIWKNSLGNYDSQYSVSEYINQHIDLTLNGLLKI